MPTPKKHLRSITLPCRSHPRTDRLDTLLNRVKTWESLSNPSSDMVLGGLSQLTELYECLDELLQTSVPKNSSLEWTEELLDVSVKFLDMCSSTADVISQTKEQLRNLECDLRRSRRGGSSSESIIAKYMLFRHKMKKDIKGWVASLKQLDNFFLADSENRHILRAFREVKALSIVIFRLLLVFLATPLVKKRPTGRWTAVSRFLSNGKVIPEEKASLNEFQGLDAALFTYDTSVKQECIPNVQNKVEALEATLEGMESHLGLLSKRLIATRASLLNMLSFQY